jgi:DNA-directed RNA polymerase specialized sigma24 family protein
MSVSQASDVPEPVRSGRSNSDRRQRSRWLKHNNKVLHYFVLQAALTGTPYQRIAELTGLSPATVARWVARDTAAARQTPNRLPERPQP